MANNKGYLENKNGDKLYPDQYDSGWINLTLINGTVRNQIPQYRVVRNKIVIRFDINNSHPGSGAQDIAGPLPLEYRPNSTVYGNVNLGGIRLARCYINTGGYIGLDWVINLSDGSNFTGNQWFNFRTEYDLD